MKHPFSSIIISKDGSLMFGAVKNNILMIDLVGGKLLDQWTDEVGTNFVIEKKFEKIIKSAKEQHGKLEGANSGNADAAAGSIAEGLPTNKVDDKSNEREENPKKKQKKIPKIPTPGPGAPEVFSDIKNMCLSANEKYLVITTNSDKAVVIFEIAGNAKDTTDHKLRLVKRQPFPKRPSSLAVTQDEKYLIMGDKFGDVYRMEIDTPVVEDLIETPAVKDVSTNGSLLTPILGHVSMLTSLVLYKEKFILTADRDEHIRISRYPDSFIIEKFLFGHGEFVSQLILFNGDFLVSAGGDSYLLLWDLSQTQSNKPLQKIPINELIQPYLTDSHNVPERWLKEGKPTKEFSVSKMIFDEKLQKLFVLVEQTNAILVFKFNKDQKLFTFEATVDAESTIVDFAIAKDHLLYLAVDSEELIKIYNLSKGGFEKDPQNIESLSNFEMANDKKYPLYTTNQLRKRSEH